MELPLILTFLAASIALTLMPGPDNIFVLTESLTKGYKHGIAISFGLCLGVFIHTIAAATGLSIIIQQSTIAFAILKYFGVAYLLYLAYLSMKESAPHSDFNISKLKSDLQVLPLIRKGFLMNILNPKVVLFFIAFLPQFIRPTKVSITLQMIFLGTIFMLQALVLFSLLAILSGQLTQLLNRPRFWKITKWTKVSVLCALAVTLLVANK